MYVRDLQRSKVYAWEKRVVKPRDSSKVPFAAVQGMVDAIWADLGLKYPPKVVPLPKQARRHAATGTRLTLEFPEETSSWIVLHEVAHALSSDAEGRSNHHGAIFVGLYMQLLNRYMRLPMDYLAHTLTEAGIRFDPEAKPIFVD